MLLPCISNGVNSALLETNLLYHVKSFIIKSLFFEDGSWRVTNHWLHHQLPIYRRFRSTKDIFLEQGSILVWKMQKLVCLLRWFQYIILGHDYCGKIIAPFMILSWRHIQRMPRIFVIHRRIGLQQYRINLLDIIIRFFSYRCTAIFEIRNTLNDCRVGYLSSSLSYSLSSSLDIIDDLLYLIEVSLLGQPVFPVS